MDEKDIKLHILDDEATDNDAFNSHQRVANAIASVITSDHKGKAIGLTGLWGSGKSSIVKMLTKLLNKNKCDVIIYNAWAHEGDPLRRSFLETLLNYFINNKTFKEHDWKDFKEDLSNKKETNSVINITKTTCEGVLLIIATVLAPFGLVLLSKYPDLWNNDRWVVYISVFFSVLPFLIILFIVFKYLYYKYCKKTEKIDLLALLIDKSIKRTTSTTLKSPDPTSIEFQERFYKILDEAFLNRTKLLIVVDNLDRIDANEALKIWSTMKLFFEYSNSSKKWNDKVWLLVPYDFQSIVNIFTADTAASFLEKTFQISFETPLPVLSDWRDYFIDKVKTAFENFNDDDEIYNVFNIYRLKGISIKHPPTPREIKLFINNLITIYSVVDKEIPLHMQALYILLRKDRWIRDETLLNDLRDSSSDFLNPISDEMLPKEYRTHLAAIYFNVEIKRASQLLIEQPLEIALTSCDLPELTKMESLAGFTQVCEDIVRKYIDTWVDKEPSIIGMVSYSIKNLNIERDFYLNKTWLNIVRNISQVSNWKTLNENSGKGIGYVIEKQADLTLSKDLISKISNSENLFENEPPEPDMSQVIKDDKMLLQIMSGYFEILKALKDTNQIEEVKNEILIFATSKSYNHIMSLLLRNIGSNEFYNYLLPAAEVADVVENLAWRVKQKEFEDVIWVKVIEEYLQMDILWDWKAFVTSVDNRISEVTNIENIEISNLLDSLYNLQLENIAEVTELLKKISEDGTTMHHLASVDFITEPRIAARYIFNLLSYNPSGTVSQAKTSSAEGVVKYNVLLKEVSKYSALLNELSNLIIQFVATEVIFDLNNDLTVKLQQELVKIITAKEDVLKIIPESEIIENDAFLYLSLEKNSYNDLIKKYVENSTLADLVISQGYDSKYATLYKAILLILNENKYNTFITEGLGRLSKEQWLSEIQECDNYNNSIDVIVALFEKNIKSNLSVNFFDALEEYAINYNPEKSSSTVNGNWSKLLFALDDSYRKTILRNILRKIINSEEPTQNLLNLFKKDLFDCDILNENSEELIREGFTKFLKRKDGAEVNWMKSAFENCKDIINRCSPETLITFKDRLKHELESPDLEAEIRSELSLIGNILFLTWSPPNDAENNSE